MISKSELFTKAHRWTKLTIETGDDYRATFALCLKALYAESRKPSLTPEALEAIGGNRWQKGDLDRVYFNDLADLYGLDYTTYKTGNIMSASLGGEKISNSKASKILSSLNFGKLWYDCHTNEFHHRGLDAYFGDLIQAIQSKI